MNPQHLLIMPRITAQHAPTNTLHQKTSNIKQDEDQCQSLRLDTPDPLIWQEEIKRYDVKLAFYA